MEPSYYAQIPANVRYDKTLKPNAKLLYGEITALANREGYCWAPNEYFATLYEVDVLTISRWISQLKNAGYIDVELFPKKNNLRHIHIDKKIKTYIQKNQEVLTKKSIPLDEKVNPIYENITINNTKNIEGTALSFLQSNFATRFEAWMMQYKTKIGNDFERFSDDYNCKVIEEGLEWVADKLFARLTRLSNNWQAKAAEFNAKGGTSYGNVNNAAPQHGRIELKKRA